MIDPAWAPFPSEITAVEPAFWTFLIQLGVGILMQLVESLFTKEQPPPPSAELDDFEPNGKEIGSPILAFGGTVEFEPVPLWHGDLEARAIRKKGGKK